MNFKLLVILSAFSTLFSLSSFAGNGTGYFDVYKIHAPQTNFASNPKIFTVHLYNESHAEMGKMTCILAERGDYEQKSFIEMDDGTSLNFSNFQVCREALNSVYNALVNESKPFVRIQYISGEISGVTPFDHNY